jgi:glycosyltransferase involved in cell wall biosynthesis
VVIPHGVPDFPFNDAVSYKKQKRLSDRLVLGNINLLNPNKGIEYALDAVALIAKKYPEVMYLVIGQTHPELLRHEGERYRLHLKKRARELGITENVRFINKYLSIDDLIRWLKTIDMYVTPYLDLQQVTSGALAYAIGAGKPCISTPYIYASEVLAEGRGIIVPPRDAAAIAKNVMALWRNTRKRQEMERASYRYGRLMTWPNVAHSLLGLFRTVVENQEKREARQLNRQFAGTPERSLQPSVQR